jgi:lipoprotein-anchoring transpeptidase ErfK/SrfK
VEESFREIAEHIRTQNIQGRLRSSGKLYTSSGLSTVKKSGIPAGTQVTVLQSRSSSATQVRLSDGTVGWMPYSNVAIVNGQYYVTTDYSKAVKEYYVNKVRNWSSSKSYMIWVSLYTQRVNIFRGSRGKWVLVRSGPIGSGRNDCPTPVETASLQYHTTWYYPLPNNNPPFYCHHVTVFDDARGFHSRPTKWGEPIGSILYYGIGYPCSHGCVRLLDEDCIYISDVLPLGTTVHIY